MKTFFMGIICLVTCVQFYFNTNIDAKVNGLRAHFEVQARQRVFDNYLSNLRYENLVNKITEQKQ